MKKTRSRKSRDTVPFSSGSFLFTTDLKTFL